MSKDSKVPLLPHQPDPALLESFRYINSMPGKNVRSTLIDCFQSWMNVESVSVLNSIKVRWYRKALFILLAMPIFHSQCHVLPSHHNIVSTGYCGWFAQCVINDWWYRGQQQTEAWHSGGTFYFWNPECHQWGQLCLLFGTGEMSWTQESTSHECVCGRASQSTSRTRTWYFGTLPFLWPFLNQTMLNIGLPFIRTHFVFNNHVFLSKVERWC